MKTFTATMVCLVTLVIPIPSTLQADDSLAKSEDYQPKLVRGLELCLRNKIDEALSVFRSLEKKQNTAEVQAGIAYAFSFKNELKESQKHVDNALKIDSTSSIAKSVNAVLSAKNGKIEDAIALIDQVVTVDPGCSFGWMAQSQIMSLGVLQGNKTCTVEKARRSAEQVIENNKDFLADAILLVAVSQFGRLQGKLSSEDVRGLSAALVSLERAKKLCPDLPMLHFTKAVIKNRLTNKSSTQCGKDWAKAIIHDPVYGAMFVDLLVQSLFFPETQEVPGLMELAEQALTSLTNKDFTNAEQVFLRSKKLSQSAIAYVEKQVRNGAQNGPSAELKNRLPELKRANQNAIELFERVVNKRKQIAQG